MADAVFPIKSAEGVDIYSLVVVPHAESPHEMKEDALVYIDDINIHLTNAPRITLLKSEGTAKKKAHSEFVSVTEANRNGMVTAADGTTLNNHKVAYGKPFKVKMVPAPGFTYGDFTITHGDQVESLKKTEYRQGWHLYHSSQMDGWQRNHRVHIYLDKQIKIRYIHIKTAWNFMGDSKLFLYFHYFCFLLHLPFQSSVFLLIP